MLHLASRTQRLRASATLAFQEKARALKASGVDIISLNMGEPDFDVPMNIKAQAIEAIHERKNKYTAVRGVPELLEAIVQEYKDAYALTYHPTQIVVTNGAKQAFFNALLCLVGSGDEVVLQAPFWPSYYDMVQLVGGTPVVIHSSIAEHFAMTAEALERHITPKTKCVVFNSPCNPTGQIISRKLYKEYAEVLRRHPHVCVITDDVYEMLNWEPHRVHWLQAAPDMMDRTVIVSGLSKGFAMAGWRLGYALGPVDLINKMVDYQSQTTSNVCSISQYAGIEALTGERYSLAEMLVAYKSRHDLMYAMLSSNELINVIKSQGTFYMLPDMTQVIEHMGFSNADELSLYCLEKAEVSIMSGTSFGAPNHMRFSFANKCDKLEEGLSRFLLMISKGI